MDSLKSRLKYSTIFISVFIVIVICVYYIGIAINYPLKYTDEINDAAAEFGVSRSLISAVIKTESDFDEKSISAKGAKGLMQITDSTAEYIAGLLGEESYDILDAKTNIRFGTYYLKYLFYKFKTLNEVLCAYNAGEGTVGEWLNDKKYSRDGKTLKKVPYAETSRYVRKVRGSMTVYEKRIKKKAKSVWSLVVSRQN